MYWEVKVGEEKKEQEMIVKRDCFKELVSTPGFVVCCVYIKLTEIYCLLLHFYHSPFSILHLNPYCHLHKTHKLLTRKAVGKLPDCNDLGYLNII